MIREKLKAMFETKVASALPSRDYDFQVVIGLNGAYRLSMVCNSHEGDNLRHLDAVYNQVDLTLKIFSIGLSEKARGKGYGRKLLESVESFASDIGAKKVVAKDSLNDSFWSHMGYKPQPSSYFILRRHFEKKLC